LPPLPYREALLYRHFRHGDVLDLTVLHAKTVHGCEDSPELRDQIRSMLQDEDATSEAA
jgi:phosphodiesterase/alkaline phosphatase D-like protein